MLFLSLLYYLLLFPLYYWLLMPNLPPVGGFAKPFWIGVLYLICLGLALLTSFIIRIYAPRHQIQITRLSRITGSRWLAAFTAGLVVLATGIQFYWFAFPGMLYFAFALPIFGVSTLNALGIEWSPPPVLIEEPEENKIVLPPEAQVPDKEPTFSSNELIKAFEWEFEGRSYCIENFSIRRSVYDKLRAKDRVRDSHQWAREYVAEEITGEIRVLTQHLYERSQSYGTYKEVSFVLSFVQHVIEYERDVGEYPKYPLESLGDEAGDCEDFAILGAALLKQMGYETALLFVPGHAALGVAGAEGVPGTYKEHEGTQYFYCEMTSEGWQIGQLPEKYNEEDIEVTPVPPLPPKVVLPQEESDEA